ncbi:MAG: helix-turn-helix domain-containing protein [Roseburia sp.]|nr:helix-turn-helix domain-containing protein [Roseburia sp.]
MGRRIMVLRQKRRYSRRQLAERIGISGKFLYEIETKDRGFSIAVLLKMAAELGVTTDYILTGEESSEYDRGLFRVLGRFKPYTLETVKQLLEIVYELSKN